MGDAAIDEVLRDQQAAIVAAVQERMRGDATMAKVAEQRGLSDAELSDQVIRFYLQAIGSDLALGSTVAMAQNLQWLAALRRGHDLPFADEMVRRMFDDISDEIQARLETDALREQYVAYRTRVADLVAESFPD